MRSREIVATDGTKVTRANAANYRVNDCWKVVPRSRQYLEEGQPPNESVGIGFCASDGDPTPTPVRTPVEDAPGCFSGFLGLLSRRNS